MEQEPNISQAPSRKFWVIILGLILGAALGALVSQLMTPLYQSKVNLLVAPVSGNGETSTANSYAQAYSKLVTDPEVAEGAVSKSGVGVDAEYIKRIVSVEAAPNAPLIQITARVQDPKDAAALVNALGSELSSLTKKEAGSRTGYQADVVAEAVPPANPILPNWILNIAVGAATGLLVGGMIVLFWNDDRLQARRIDMERRRLEAQEEKKRQRREAQEEKERQRREKEFRDLERMLERYNELRSEDLQSSQQREGQSNGVSNPPLEKRLGESQEGG